MQKLLLSGLMVCVMAMPALAGLKFPDIDVKGNLSLKSIAADKYLGDTAKTDCVQLKADLNLSAELADNVGLKAVLRNESTQGAGNNNDLNAVLSQTVVYHVYLNVKDIAGVDAVIGRQNIGEKKNALVYQSSRADAIKLSKKCGPVDVTYVSANGPDNRDTLSAIMAGGKIGPANVSVANYTRQYAVPSAKSADQVIDLAVSGKIPVACGIDASLEYAKQSGGKIGTVKKDATAMLIKLGYSGCDMAVGKASCGLTILNTSGNKTSADKDEDYTGIAPSLKLTEIVSDIAAGQKNDDLTYSTAIANRNAIVINLGLAPAAVEGLTLGLAYGTYAFNEDIVNICTKGKYATEINLTAGYKVSDAVSMSLLLAQMDPKIIGGNTDKATKIQAGMKIVF